LDVHHKDDHGRDRRPSLSASKDDLLAGDHVGLERRLHDELQLFGLQRRITDAAFDVETVSVTETQQIHLRQQRFELREHDSTHLLKDGKVDFETNENAIIAYPHTPTPGERR